jgi:hypothetical protein
LLALAVMACRRGSEGETTPTIEPKRATESEREPDPMPPLRPFERFIASRALERPELIVDLVTDFPKNTKPCFADSAVEVARAAVDPQREACCSAVANHIVARSGVRELEERGRMLLPGLCVSAVAEALSELAVDPRWRELDQAAAVVSFDATSVVPLIGDLYESEHLRDNVGLPSGVVGYGCPDHAVLRMASHDQIDGLLDRHDCGPTCAAAGTLSNGPREAMAVRHKCVPADLGVSTELERDLVAQRIGTHLVVTGLAALEQSFAALEASDSWLAAQLQGYVHAHAPVLRCARFPAEYPWVAAPGLDTIIEPPDPDAVESSRAGGWVVAEHYAVLHRGRLVLGRSPVVHFDARGRVRVSGTADPTTPVPQRLDRETFAALADSLEGEAAPLGEGCSPVLSPAAATRVALIVDRDTPMREVLDVRRRFADAGVDVHLVLEGHVQRMLALAPPVEGAQTLEVTPPGWEIESDEIALPPGADDVTIVVTPNTPVARAVDAAMWAGRTDATVAFSLRGSRGSGSEAEKNRSARERIRGRGNGPSR